MSENSSSGSGGGIGFTGLLQIVFIVLKLTEYVSWSWFWVLSPAWISLLVIIFCAFLVLLAAIVAIAKGR